MVDEDVKCVFGLGGKFYGSRRNLELSYLPSRINRNTVGRFLDLRSGVNLILNLHLFFITDHLHIRKYEIKTRCDTFY